MASIDDLATEYGVSPEAVRVLQDALRRGGGKQAQFSHPDLGGMGQWSAGGMTQVGDMFNTALKDKVNRLCSALAKRCRGRAGTGAQDGSRQRLVAGRLGPPVRNRGAERDEVCLLPGHAPGGCGASRPGDAVRQRGAPDIGRVAATERHAGAHVQQPEGDDPGKRPARCGLILRQSCGSKAERVTIQFIGRGVATAMARASEQIVAMMNF